MPELPAPRAGAGVVSVGGRVYVCGGSNGSQATATVWSIDPSEPGGTWREEPSMQRPRCALSGACTAVRTAAGEALIVVCGGRSDAGLLSPEAAHVLQSVAVFSLATGTWREDRPLRSARWGAPCCSFAGRVYLVGGSDAGGTLLHDVLSLRPGDKYWREEPDLHRARASHVAGVVVRPTSLRYVECLYHVCKYVCICVCIYLCVLCM